MQAFRISTTLTTVLFLSLAQSYAEPVAVSDPALRAVLREILKRRGVDKEDIDSKDLQAIYFIDAARKSITDLSGLQHCTNLRDIRLAENKLESIEPLAGCTHLQILDLSSNQLSDISTLASLETLQYLNIENNAIQQIECVASMKLLRTLYANNNKVTNIEAVSNLIKLHSIYLARNIIEDISPLAKLPQLASIDLRQNKISDVRPLTQLRNIRWAFLSGNEIEDITPFADMARADAAAQEEFAHLLKLFLQDNPLDKNSTRALQLLAESGVTVITKSSKQQISSKPPAADEQDSERLDAANPQPVVNSPQ